MKCCNCGIDLAKGVIFCRECGAKVTMDKRYCRECGSALTEGVKFSSYCGSSVKFQILNKEEKSGKASDYKPLTLITG